MSKIKHVLLIPEAGNPHGLLQEGPCGARPPMASPYEGKFEAHTSDWAPCWPGETALVLAWDGEPVAEGLDRLGRAENVTREWVSKVVGFALGWWPDDVDALTDPDLPGTLVLLDAEGREVSDG